MRECYCPPSYGALETLSYPTYNHTHYPYNTHPYAHPTYNTNHPYTHRPNYNPHPYATHPTHQHAPQIHDLIGQHNTYLTVKNDLSDTFKVYWVGVGVAPQCAVGFVPPFAFVCASAVLAPGEKKENKMAGYGNSVGLVNLRTNQVYGYKQSFDKQNDKVSRTTKQIVNNSYDLGILNTLLKGECVVARWFGMIPGAGWVLDKVGLKDACNL